MKNLFSGQAFGVMRIGDFRTFMLYRFFMTTATAMQAIVVGWHVYAITGNVFMLGLIGLTEVIPQIGISLFAGHFADLWDRRKIILYTSMLLLIGSGILILFSMPSTKLLELYGVLPIFVTIFLTGLARGVLMPAHTAIIGQMVPRELYTNAATWNSTNWHIAAVTGPSIGGLIYGFWGNFPAYSFVFLFYLSAFILMLGIRKSYKTISPESTTGMMERISEGIRFVFKQKILLGALTLDMFAVLFGGAVAMLPAFASEILKTGPEGLGLLRSAPALGAIIMSVFLAWRPPVNNSGILLLICVTGFGLCMIGFALSTHFLLSMIFLFASGMFDNVSVVIRGTIVQLFTPDEMRGRVAAVNSIFIGSSNELGQFESGVAARIMGLVPSVIFGGAMTISVVIATALKSPILRKLKLKEHISG